MARSRNPDKSPSTESPSSNNSRRNSVSDDKKLLNNVHPSSRSGSLSTPSTSSKKPPERTEFVAKYKSYEEAVERTLAKISTQITKANLNGEWSYTWAGKHTSASKEHSGILNVGRVIGRSYKDDSIGFKLDYRVDWDPDPEKGKHVNTTLCMKNNWDLPDITRPDRVAFRFGDHSHDIQMSEDGVRTLGHIDFNRMTVELTSQALLDKADMTSTYAGRILKTFQSPEFHLINHFKELRDALRPLINCAHAAYNRNDDNLPNILKYDIGELHKTITTHLKEQWAPAADMLLKDIQAPPKEFKDKDSKDKYLKSRATFLGSKSLNLLRSEMIFSVSDEKLGSSVFLELNSFFKNTSSDLLKKFLDELSKLIRPQDRKLFTKYSEIMLNEPRKTAYLESIVSKIKPEVEVKPVPPPRPPRSSYATMLSGMAGSKAEAITALKNRVATPAEVTQPSLQVSRESSRGASANKKVEHESSEDIEPRKPTIGKP